MATTLHEWRCPKCGKRAWSRTKDKGHVFLKKAVLCSLCRIPMQGTGNKRKKYSLQELL